MEQYVIKGGNPLVGEVEIGGAKNAALAILAAAIMTDETVHIENLPDHAGRTDGRLPEKDCPACAGQVNGCAGRM